MTVRTLLYADPSQGPEMGEEPLYRIVGSNGWRERVQRILCEEKRPINLLHHPFHSSFSTDPAWAKLESLHQQPEHWLQNNVGQDDGAFGVTVYSSNDLILDICTALCSTCSALSCSRSWREHTS